MAYTRLDDEVHAALTTEAQAQNRTLSSLIAYILALFVKDRKANDDT